MLLQLSVSIVHLSVFIFVFIYLYLWYGVDYKGPITFVDTDHSVIISPTDNPLSSAVQEILLQETDQASDDVGPEQMPVAVCVFVDALAKTFKFVNSLIRIMYKLKRLLIQISLATECSP